MQKRPIYLDNHSTTMMAPEVFEAMNRYLTDSYGNAASSAHLYGLEAEVAVEKARKNIAEYIGAKPEEILFTSGATESINLAIKGSAESNYKKGMHIITSVIEHPAVLDTLEYLKTKGLSITKVPVDSGGFVDPDDVKKAIRKDTILVTIMTANNEIGSIQDVNALANVCEEHEVTFHSDATQAVGKVHLNVNETHVHLLSFSAHKLHGPKGIGVLYIGENNPNTKPVMQIHGGGHEFGYRSGTLNVPAIVGFSEAITLLKKTNIEEIRYLKSMRDLFWESLTEVLPSIHKNGSEKNRLVNNLNIRFDGLHADTLLMKMKNDIAASTGSACASAEKKISHVLKAIGLNHEQVKSSIRFGLSRYNTKEEIERASKLIINYVNELMD